MRILFGCILVVAVAVTSGDDASACSCISYSDMLVDGNASKVPLNYRIRVQLRGSRRADKPLLRAFRGAEIPVNARSWVDGEYTLLELVPTRLLGPNALYEVVVADHVIGQFTTSTTADTTAPVIQAIGSVSADSKPDAFIPACQSAGPWVDIGPIKAADPGRPNAQLVYAVWVFDAAGKVDVARPPDRLLPSESEMLVVGRRSRCERHDFSFSKAPTVTLAIAAVDEAGNASAPTTLTVRMPP